MKKDYWLLKFFIKWFLAIIFFLALLIFAGDSFGAGYFEDDFETYGLGVKNGQGVWIASTEAHCSITIQETYSVEGVKSERNTNTSNGQSCVASATGTDMGASGSIGWWFLVDNLQECRYETLSNSNFFEFLLFGTENNEKIYIGLNASTTPAKIQYKDSTGAWIDLGELASTTWHAIEVEWNTSENKVRYALDFAPFTGWVAPPYTITATTSGYFRELNRNGSVHCGDIYVDTIEQNISVFSQCGRGTYCMFCNNQTDCEANNCQWILLDYPYLGAGYCLQSEAPISYETSTYFSNYYTEHSEFSTPTELVSRLASSSAPFLIALSSWLENFSDRFDLAIAQEYGERVGNAFSTARGYADTFNDLFNDLPVSEVLIIYLTVILAIVIFRVVRQIKKLFTV